jgi:hypothetical protein
LLEAVEALALVVLGLVQAVAAEVKFFLEEQV